MKKDLVWHKVAGLEDLPDGRVMSAKAGGKINNEILNHVAVPVTIEASLEKIGNLYCLAYKTDSLRRIS